MSNTNNNTSNRRPYANRLPGQKGTDPLCDHNEERQHKIYVFAFQQVRDVTVPFHADGFRQQTQEFIRKYKFFNARNNRSRNSRNERFNFTEVNPARQLVQYGARMCFLMRPKIHPLTNMHTLTRAFNEEHANGGHYMTIWVKAVTLERWAANPHQLERYMKIANYEYQWLDEPWNRTALPVYDNVLDYVNENRMVLV